MQIKYYKFLPNSGKINLDGNVKVLLGENSSGGYSPINIIGNKRGGIDVYATKTFSYLLSNDFDTNYSVPSSNVTIKIINQEDIEKEILVRNGYISYITTVNSGIENIYTQMINYVNIVKTSTGEETFTATKTLNYIPVRLVI